MFFLQALSTLLHRKFRLAFVIVYRFAVSPCYNSPGLSAILSLLAQLVNSHRLPRPFIPPVVKMSVSTKTIDCTKHEAFITHDKRMMLGEGGLYRPADRTLHCWFSPHLLGLHKLIDDIVQISILSGSLCRRYTSLN